MKLGFSGQIFEKYSNINIIKMFPFGADLFHGDEWTEGRPVTV